MNNQLSSSYNHRRLSIILLCITMVLLSVGFIGFNYTANVQNILLLVFFCTVGLPHGAMDHIIHHKIQETIVRKKKKMRPYIMAALVEMILYSLVWVLFPMVGFILFLAISAYHFGESQMYYGVDNTFNLLIKILIYTLWGTNVLGAMMIFQLQETQIILSSLFSDFTVTHLLYNFLDQNTIEIVLILSILNFFGLAYLLYKKSILLKDFILETAILGVLLVVFFTNPLYISFLIYFSLWHSIKAIQQIFIFYQKKEEKFTIKKFYSITFIYTLISIVGIGVILLINHYFQFLANYTFLFFIIIGILTLPHFHLFSKMYTINSS